MECILCPNKGGAMKPCNIKKNSDLYYNIQNCRKSKQYDLNELKMPKEEKLANFELNTNSNISLIHYIPISKKSKDEDFMNGSSNMTCSLE